MTDHTEDELLAMLSEPTANKVRRDQARADIALIALGRAFAQLVNADLADLAEKIAADKEPKT